MNQQSSSKTFPIAIGLLNLSGLSLGYLYVKNWVRWAIHFFITIALIAAAFLTNASKQPTVWISVFILWLLWMAYDGWRQGQKDTKGLFPIKQSWLLLLIPLVILGLAGSGIAGYCALGQKEFHQGMDAYQEVNCEEALEHFNQVTTLYELTLSSDISTADSRIEECGTFLPAKNAHEAEEYAEAIKLYQKYLDEYPKGDLNSHTLEAMSTSYFEWAAELNADAKYQEAIDKYLTILDTYPDTSAAGQVTPLLSKSYLSLSSQLWESKDYQEAIANARIPLEEYPSTQSGKDASEQVAQIYYDWAVDIQTQERYEEALGKILVVLDEFPDTQAGENVPALAAELYSQWAGELRSEGLYQEAVDKILVVLDEFPNTETGKGAPAFAAELYQDWADDLMAKDEYQDSIAKYEILLDEYSAFVSSGDIEATIKTAYLSWATHLRENGEYQDTISLYRTLRNAYPQTITADETDKLILETHLAWGDAYYQEGEFTKALDKFLEAKELTSDPDLIQLAEEGYDEALKGLSRDTGSTGSQIVQDTLSSACNKEPAESPAVGILEDEPGKALACSSTPSIRLPQDLKANYPGHFKYVVSATEGYTTVQTCPYQSGYKLIRQQQYWTVLVRNTVTGGVYSSKTFYGSMPDKCNQTEWFYSNIKYKYGTEPSMDEVLGWLEAVIR